MGIINKRNKAITGYRTARKVELQKRARELEYFNQWKGSEKHAVAQDKDYKKYETFIKNNPDFGDYTYQEWKDLVNTLGTMEDKLQEFVYEDMKQLHLESTQRKTSKTLLEAMEDAKSKSNGAGLDQEDLTDLVRSELFS